MEDRHEQLYLGLDGGGSKTAAVIIDSEGAELGRGWGGPGNIAHNPDAVLVRSVCAATGEACRAAGLSPASVRFNAVCAGMAGYSVEARRPVFDKILRDTVQAQTYLLEPDYVVAYWGATHGEPGIIMIAGTGAVAYGNNAEGASYREDGLGYLLGDRGSGFNLGLRVLRFALDQMKEDRTDSLTQAILAATGAQNQNQILHWLYSDFSPARVAALAPIVGELAEAGDAAARNHVAAMSQRLRHSVRQVRHKLWLPRDTPVYPLGGLWNLGEFFRSEFADPQWQSDPAAAQDREALPGGRFNITAPRSDAAYGAALLARKE